MCFIIRILYEQQKVQHDCPVEGIEYLIVMVGECL